MKSVFISYSRRDRAFASRLANDLKSRGMYVWYDQWELKVGDSLMDRINAGIRSQDYIIVVLSKASVKSLWVIKELNAAYIRELEEKRIVLLPVLIEDCNIPSLLSDKVYADFRHNYASGLRKLLDRFPGGMFVSGISIRERRSLAQNVHLENIVTTNLVDNVVRG